LGASETKKVAIEIPAKNFRYWDVAKKEYVIEPGDYELLIGAASNDVRLRVPFEIVRAQ
jgi:beta-glucosidase